MKDFSALVLIFDELDMGIFQTPIELNLDRRSTTPEKNSRVIVHAESRSVHHRSAIPRASFNRSTRSISRAISLASLSSGAVANASRQSQPLDTVVVPISVSATAGSTSLPMNEKLLAVEVVRVDDAFRFRDGNDGGCVGVGLFDGCFSFRYSVRVLSRNSAQAANTRGVTVSRSSIAARIVAWWESGSKDEPEPVSK